MKFLGTSAAVLGVALSLVATPAFAAPFRLDAGIGGVTTGDLTGYINFSGTPLVNNEHVFIGPLNMTVTDTATNTAIQQTLWCTDIFHNFQAGALYNLSQSSLAGRIGNTKTNQINALLANVTPSDAAQGAAVQAAIWEIENETGVTGYDITTGLLTATVDTNAAEFAGDISTYLGNVSGTNGSNGIWQPAAGFSVTEYLPINGSNQTFGFLELTGGGGNIPVPEPATLGILGLGVFGVAAARRKRQSRPA